MIKYFLFLSMSLGIQTALAATNIVKVEPIGNSPRGKYFAIEEYGYHSQTNRPFSRIRLVNVFQNQYVGSEIEVDNELELGQARKLARKRVLSQAQRYRVQIADLES